MCLDSIEKRHDPPLEVVEGYKWVSVQPAPEGAPGGVILCSPIVGDTRAFPGELVIAKSGYGNPVNLERVNSEPARSGEFALCTEDDWNEQYHVGFHGFPTVRDALRFANDFGWEPAGHRDLRLWKARFYRVHTEGLQERAVTFVADQVEFLHQVEV